MTSSAPVESKTNVVDMQLQRNTITERGCGSIKITGNSFQP